MKESFVQNSTSNFWRQGFFASQEAIETLPSEVTQIWNISAL